MSSSCCRASVGYWEAVPNTSPSNRTAKLLSLKTFLFTQSYPDILLQFFFVVLAVFYLGHVKKF